MNNNYTAYQISLYIIWYSNINKLPINNLRLQRLLYFVQAYFLICSEGKRCAFSDNIIAESYGPMIPYVHHEFQKYGGCSIPIQTTNIALINDEDKNIINEVIEYYKNKSSAYLWQLISNQSPWQDAYKHKNQGVITLEAIYDYFKEEKNDR